VSLCGVTQEFEERERSMRIELESLREMQSRSQFNTDSAGLQHKCDVSVWVLNGCVGEGGGGWV